LLPADIERSRFRRDPQRAEGPPQQALADRRDRERNRHRAVGWCSSVQLPEQSDLFVATELRAAVRSRYGLVEIDGERGAAVDKKQIGDAGPTGVERDLGESRTPPRC